MLTTHSPTSEEDKYSSSSASTSHNESLSDSSSSPIDSLSDVTPSPSSSSSSSSDGSSDSNRTKPDHEHFAPLDDEDRRDSQRFESIYHEAEARGIAVRPMFSKVAIVGWIALAGTIIIGESYKRRRRREKELEEENARNVGINGTSR